MHVVRCEGKVYAPSKVICVGRNFESHVAEMGAAGHLLEEPTIFIKPNSAIAVGRDAIFIPEALGLLHHEVELCFIVGRRFKGVSAAKAPSYIEGYAVGLDLTLRDIQSVAKIDGMPWTIAKGFDNSAVFGEFVCMSHVADPQALDIQLSVNGRVRQHANTREMIFSPAEILSFAARFMTIEPGDVVMCGTPGGVGEISHDDVLVARIEGLPVLEVTVKRA